MPRNFQLPFPTWMSKTEPLSSFLTRSAEFERATPSRKRRSAHSDVLIVTCGIEPPTPRFDGPAARPSAPSTWQRISMRCERSKLVCNAEPMKSEKTATTTNTPKSTRRTAFPFGLDLRPGSCDESPSVTCTLTPQLAPCPRCCTYRGPCAPVTTPLNASGIREVPRSPSGRRYSLPTADAPPMSQSAVKSIPSLAQLRATVVEARRPSSITPPHRWTASPNLFDAMLPPPPVTIPLPRSFLHHRPLGLPCGSTATHDLKAAASR